MNFCDPFSGTSHTKGTADLWIWGRIWNSTKGPEISLAKRGTLHMVPQAKSPPKQTICIRRLSFVFNHENMQLSIFSITLEKQKSENQRLSQILIDTNTPLSLKEVKGSTTNLVQYNRVLKYSLCDTNIRFAIFLAYFGRFLQMVAGFISLYVINWLQNTILFL